MDFLCLEFINSRWFARRKPFEDPLEQPEWLTRFCEKWDLPEPGTDAATLDVLRGLRGLLAEAAAEFRGLRGLSAGLQARLNARLEAAPFSQRLEATEDGRLRLGLVPCNRDPAWFSACVVRSFALLLTEYAPERLKCCANPECGWFFYDESKNQTRKWCDNACASLLKVRRFRSRAQPPAAR